MRRYWKKPKTPKRGDREGPPAAPLRPGRGPAASVRFLAQGKERRYVLHGPLNGQEMTCEFGAVGTGLGRGGGSRALSGGRRTNAKRPEWCPIDTAAGMSLSFCRALATPPVPSSTVACWRAALCSRWRAPARPPHGKGAAGLQFQALGRCPAPSCCAPCSSTRPARSKSPAIAPRLVPTPRGLWPGLGLCAAVAAGRRGQVGGAVLGSRLPPPDRPCGRR